MLFHRFCSVFLEHMYMYVCGQSDEVNFRFLSRDYIPNIRDMGDLFLHPPTKRMTMVSTVCIHCTTVNVPTFSN